MTYSNLSNELEKYVADYKKWAFLYPIHLKSGEWEDEYPSWSKLETVFYNFIDHINQYLWSEKDYSNLFYTIGRDNNGYKIMDFISEKEEIFFQLASKSIACNDNEAKWQFAIQLGTNTKNKKLAENVLLKLFIDENEYVRRMSLSSLGKIGSTAIESLVKSAWDTENVYQRMTVLTALSDIGSSLLPHYLQMAIADGRPYLVAEAQKITSNSSHKTNAEN